MHVVPVSEALGVELRDFDLQRPCDLTEQAELRALFCEHHLLLVRGQDVTADDQSRFVGYFGPLHARADGMKETFVTNVADDGAPPRTGTARLIWHQDGTYGLRPGIATSLWAQEVAADAVPTVVRQRACAPSSACLRTCAPASIRCTSCTCETPRRSGPTTAGAQRTSLRMRRPVGSCATNIRSSTRCRTPTSRRSWSTSC